MKASVEKLVIVELIPLEKHPEKNTIMRFGGSLNKRIRLETLIIFKKNSLMR